MSNVRMLQCGLFVLVLASSAAAQSVSPIDRSYAELGLGTVDNGGDGDYWGADLFFKAPNAFYVRTGFASTSIDAGWYDTDTQELSLVVGGQFPATPNVSFNVGAGVMHTSFDTRWDDESEAGYMYELGIRYVPGAFSMEIFYRDGELFEDNIETDGSGTLKVGYLFNPSFGIFAAFDTSSDVNRFRGGIKFSW